MWLNLRKFPLWFKSPKKQDAKSPFWELSAWRKDTQHLFFFWDLSQSKELYNIKPPLVKKAHFSSSIPLCQSFPLRLQNCTWNGRILIADFSPDFVSVRLLIWNCLKSDCTIEPYFLFFQSFELKDTIISALKFRHFSSLYDFQLRSRIVLFAPSLYIGGHQKPERPITN